MPLFLYSPLLAQESDVLQDSDGAKRYLIALKRIGDLGIGSGQRRDLSGAARYVIDMGRMYGRFYNPALYRNNAGQSIRPLMAFC